MSAINGHIHMCYVNEWRVSSDQWDEGEVGLSFWMVPDAAITGTERRPVGVRTLPNPNGQQEPLCILLDCYYACLLE